MAILDICFSSNLPSVAIVNNWFANSKIFGFPSTREIVSAIFINVFGLIRNMSAPLLIKKSYTFLGVLSKLFISQNSSSALNKVLKEVNQAAEERITLSAKCCFRQEGTLQSCCYTQMPMAGFPKG